jgi:hypothetical protein
MRCPRCQAKNPDNPRFYHHCDHLDDTLSKTKRLFVSSPFILGRSSQTSPRQSWAWAWSGFPGRDLGAALRTGPGEPDAALLAETGGHARKSPGGVL